MSERACQQNDRTLADGQERIEAMAKLMAMRGVTNRGISSNKMALITSDFDAMCFHEHQMALITSGCAPFR